MDTQTRSADEMVNMVIGNPQRLEALKADPLPELGKLRDEAVKTVPPAYTGDRLLYRIAIVVLSSLALITAIGSILITIGMKEPTPTPEVLVALGSAAVGALVGLFAPSPTGK